MTRLWSNFGGLCCVQFTFKFTGQKETDSACSDWTSLPCVEGLDTAAVNSTRFGAVSSYSSRRSPGPEFSARDLRMPHAGCISAGYCTKQLALPRLLLVLHKQFYQNRIACSGSVQQFPCLKRQLDNKIGPCRTRKSARSAT